MGLDNNSQGARIGELEQKAARLETRAEDNWKNLTGEIKELKNSQKELTEEVKDVKNSLSNISGQMDQMQGTLGNLTTFIEKVTTVGENQKQQQKEIDTLKIEVKELKKGDLEMRKTKLTCAASIIVALLAGVFSIITFILKK